MHAPDHELAALVEAEHAAECVRARAHGREAERHRGVAWSGFSPPAYAPTSPRQLTDRARESLTARRAWRLSLPGQFIGAVAETQMAAVAVYQACERARNAWSRDFEGEREACALAAREIEDQARLMLRNARLARRAMASAGRLTARDAADATSAPQTDAHE